MPGFYMACYTGLKWVQREYSLPQILSFCQNVSKDILLTGRKIQAKISSHSGDCILGEGQLNTLPLMAKGLGIFTIACIDNFYILLLLFEQNMVNVVRFEWYLLEYYGKGIITITFNNGKSSYLLSFYLL